MATPTLLCCYTEPLPVSSPGFGTCQILAVSVAGCLTLFSPCSHTGKGWGLQAACRISAGAWTEGFRVSHLVLVNEWWLCPLGPCECSIYCVFYVSIKKRFIVLGLCVSCFFFLSGHRGHLMDSYEQHLNKISIGCWMSESKRKAKGKREI